SYTSYFLESLKGIFDLKQLNKENKRFEELGNKSQIVNKEEKNVKKIYFTQFTFSFLIIGIGVLTFAITDILLIKQNILSLKNGILTLVVFNSSFAPFLELSRLPLGLGKALQSAKQVFTLLDKPEENFRNNKGKNIKNINNISFENLSFSYSNRDETILENLNLDINDKKIIGIIGESGSGKTTIMKLIMNWYKINKGKNLVNNENIENINDKKLQEKIVYIPQIAQIFSQTIRENLVLGNNNISDDEILELADKCRLKDKILSLDDGLDTVINSEKILFSNGEKQRLELMRALLKKADVYIFDEPTSNLDTLNEAIILNLIKENCNNTFVFLISHRMSTISCADIIYRVENKNCFKISKI
ncbi:MAG: ABC transporter ATP-binding protein, partial [Oceanivirga sp.]|nr:ABC transporter ATP-binding protein [Oceanivirga sp.]